MNIKHVRIYKLVELFLIRLLNGSNIPVIPSNIKIILHVNNSIFLLPRISKKGPTNNVLIKLQIDNPNI